MTELKPCPFCGHKIEGRQPHWSPMETDDDYYVIKCGYCGAMIYDEDYDTVIILWNRRANE